MNNHHQCYEILTCRNTTPTVRAESSRDAQGLRVQRLSSGDVVPPKAVAVAQAISAIIARSCGIRSEHLQVKVQTTQAPSEYEGQVYGGSVLLLSPDALRVDPTAHSAAIACAAQCASLLANKPAQRDAQSLNSAAVDAPVSSLPMLTLDDFAGSALLGANLPIALDVIVPGFRYVQLFNRIRRGRPSAPRTAVRTVKGRVRGIMVGKRGHRLFVSGRDTTTNAAFGDHSVSLPEQWRKAVTDALATQGQRVLLSIDEVSFNDGTAKPRVKRVLTGITLLSTPLRTPAIVTTPEELPLGPGGSSLPSMAPGV